MQKSQSICAIEHCASSLFVNNEYAVFLWLLSCSCTFVIVWLFNEQSLFKKMGKEKRLHGLPFLRTGYRVAGFASGPSFLFQTLQLGHVILVYLTKGLIFIDIHSFQKFIDSTPDLLLSTIQTWAPRKLSASSLGTEKQTTLSTNGNWRCYCKNRRIRPLSNITVLYRKSLLYSTVFSNSARCLRRFAAKMEMRRITTTTVSNKRENLPQAAVFNEVFDHCNWMGVILQRCIQSRSGTVYFNGWLFDRSISWWNGCWSLWQKESLARSSCSKLCSREFVCFFDKFRNVLRAEISARYFCTVRNFDYVCLGDWNDWFIVSRYVVIHIYLFLLFDLDFFSFEYFDNTFLLLLFFSLHF